jgi:hypothetical protein
MQGAAAGAKRRFVWLTDRFAPPVQHALLVSRHLGDAISAGGLPPLHQLGGALAAEFGGCGISRSIGIASLF